MLKYKLSEDEANRVGFFNYEVNVILEDKKNLPDDLKGFNVAKEVYYLGELIARNLILSGEVYE